MAEEIIFKTSVDTGTTAKDLQAIDKELGNIDKTTKSASTDLNKTFDDLNKRVESGTMTMRESTRAIKEYQTIALQAGRESPIGKEAIARGAELQDKLADLRNEITNASHDGKNMQAALQLGSTITAGYGALTGAQALLGQESENLTKTLVKLQAVQAILASIEEVRAALEKESFLMQKAKVIQTNILSAATAAYTVVVGTSTGAMKLLRIAMLAIPIVALVAGVAALATGLISLGNSAQDAYERTKRLREEQERLAKSLAEVSRQNLGNQFGNLNDKIAQNIELRRAQGATEKEIFQLQKDAIESQIRQLYLQNASGTRLNAQQTKQYKQLKNDLLVLEAEYNTSLSEAAEQRNKEAARKNQERLAKEKADNDEAARKAKDDAIKKAKEIYDEEQRLNQERISKEDAQYQLERSLNETQQEQEIQDLITSYDEKFLIAEGNAELEKQLQERLKTEIADINERYRQEDVDAEKAAIEEKEKADRESQKRKIQIAQDYAGAVNNLAGGIFALSNTYGKQDEKAKEERAKRQFKVQKALNLGMAIIDGYKAITASLSQSPIAIGPVPNPAGIASLAFATATSIANVAKIASAKYEGGSLNSSGAGVAPPSTVPNTPNPQLANADTTLTSGLSGNTNNQGGGKVFVVDSEITAKQNQTAQALNIATVG